MSRQPYDGVVLTAPVSIPYVRYTNETAHWWIAKALREALGIIQMTPSEIDGLSVSSFTLAPDTPVGLTQHLGISPRWLDTVPMGGACGVAAIRRAALRAAKRRGSNIMIFRAPIPVSCNSHNGTVVVLPAPGGACKTALFPASSAAIKSGRTSSTGRPIFGTEIVLTPLISRSMGPV